MAASGKAAYFSGNTTNVRKNRKRTMADNLKR